MGARFGRRCDVDQPAFVLSFSLGPNDVVRFDDVVARIHPDDRSQVIRLCSMRKRMGCLSKRNFVW